MVQPSLVLHDREWTAADLAAIDDDGHRYEIVDGALLVLTPPTRRHDWVAFRLAALLDAAAPPGLYAYGPGAVQLGRSLRAPDVVVVRRDPASRTTAADAAQDVVLAVEVLSPTTETSDRVTKPFEYARGGIEHYWLLDPEGPSLTVHVLEPEGYRRVGTWRQDDEVVVVTPVRVRFRPADLLGRGGA